MASGGVSRLRGVVALGLLVICRTAAAQPCPQGNVLEGKPPTATEGFLRFAKLTDGWATLEQAPFDDGAAVRWDDVATSITWDIGRALPLGVFELQADGNDRYVVSTSIDGAKFEPAWVRQPQVGIGLVTASGIDVEPRLSRFVRLEARDGDSVFSASELRAFCDVKGPRDWPLRVRDSSALSIRGMRQVTANSGQLAVLVLGALVALGGLLSGRLMQSRRAIALALIAASVMAWTHFGVFNGRSDLHVGDAFHYFMGPKYFKDTGYFEMYRCTAQAERELGHAGDYANVLVRDLDDNRVWHGSWFSTEAGRCRANFSPRKWDAFKRDVKGFRELIKDQGTIPRLLVDHGFNATPFHTTFLRAFVLHLEPSNFTLRLVAQMDSLALLGAIGAVWWGFGPMSAALFALLLGTGSFWGYPWLGGTIGRHVWLFWMALGLSAARRRRSALATVAFTLAGLHRLYPLFYLAAYVLWHGIRAVRHRKVTNALRSVLLAASLTLGLATVAATLSVGPRAFVDYVHVIQRHANSPGGNRLGFPLLLAERPGGFASNLMNDRLTDPSEVWVAQVRALSHAHWPMRLCAAFLALLLIVRVATKGSPWEAVLSVGPLLFALQDITSYDFVWLTLFATIAIERHRWRWWLAGYVALTLVLGMMFDDMEFQHYLANWALLALLTTIGVDMWQRPRVGAFTQNAWKLRRAIQQI